MAAERLFAMLTNKRFVSLILVVLNLFGCQLVLVLSGHMVAHMRPVCKPLITGRDSALKLTLGLLPTSLLPSNFYLFFQILLLC